MFSLDDRIEAWKNGLSHRQTLRSDDIEELEQHVRDSIARSVTRGLTEEESFWVATGRIGETDRLAHEFDKVNGGLVWAQRLFWMLGGFLLFEVCRSMIQAAGSLGLTFAAAAGGNGIVMGSVAAGLTIVGWCAVLWFLFRPHASRGGADFPGQFLANSTGLTIGVWVGAALIVTGALHTGSTVLTARLLVTPYDYGQAALISYYMRLVLAALLPLACLLAMIAIRRRLGVNAEADQAQIWPTAQRDR